MRKRFDPQMTLGILPIEQTRIRMKSRDATAKIGAALLALYCDVEHRDKVLDILANKITKGKKRTGRNGLNLWQIFVLGQFRLGLNISYDTLEDLANNHDMIRSLMGIHATGFEQPKVELEYQNIYDNLTLLSDGMLNDVNEIIVSFAGKSVFKKKVEEGSTLKTDSYVVKSNVHFPTDYNLLWDCTRKCLDMTDKLLVLKPEMKGWRNIKSWRGKLKNASRAVGMISGKGGPNRQERLVQKVETYLDFGKDLHKKLTNFLRDIPMDKDDFSFIICMSLEYYLGLMSKHIDLLNRRVLKGEQIPHEEKLFSIFEQYTEWINKGKPQIELGKKLSITTNENNLIIDYRIMENESDSQTVVDIAVDILNKYKVNSWSFDKGYYHKENKALLADKVKKVIMPKKGKLNQAEKEEEHQPSFKRLRNKHSAIESNINELEHRGLDRCPDRGYEHFKTYIGLGVCAYNLHKIGNEMRNIYMAEKKAEEEKRKKVKQSYSKAA